MQIDYYYYYYYYGTTAAQDSIRPSPPSHDSMQQRIKPYLAITMHGP